ncbi:MAG: S8 family serine peptidase, partial [Armatimonadota bacterium]
MGESSLAEARAQDWRRRGPAIAELGRRVIAAAPSFRVTKRYRIFPFLAGRADEAALRELAGCASVEGVYPDRRLRAALAESGPLIGQPTVEAEEHDGDGVGIAVVDTGIDYTHPDLDGEKVVGGYNFLAGDPEFPQYTDPNDYMDDEGHGTFVAGV